MNRLETIADVIKSMDGIKITSPFIKEEGEVISGSISVSIADVLVDFNVQILPSYPLQFHHSESIRFVNKALLKYNHVNADGSICVHTHHSPDLKKKLVFDFESLKEWIKKYYIVGTKDNHYEHIIVPHNDKSVYLFTSVDYGFRKGEFGFIEYSHLSVGFDREEKIDTYLIQNFKVGKLTYSCSWSSVYKNKEKREGLFVFIENAPTQNTRLAVEKWSDLEPYVNQDFLKFLNIASRQRYREATIPLLIGYRIPNEEIHWQCISIQTNNFPNYVEKIPGTNNYQGRFAEEAMDWAQTRNCSYKYFFGRGSFPSEITDGKILVIGLGAIGSNIATTLTRGGCKSVALIDYDVKEPENVCRAEYLFLKGVNSKTEELAEHLTHISPFVEVMLSETFMDLTKMTLTNNDWKDVLFQKLSEYDIIFDCSTDNDVAFILDQLERPSRIFTISITNNGNDLICASPPKLYKWMIDISQQLQKEADDLYSPTGCWSPTFKAGYNDVVVLVQFAIKHIANTIGRNLPLRTFYLETSTESEFNIKLKEV